jgi:hypothetical protein
VPPAGAGGPPAAGPPDGADPLGLPSVDPTVDPLQDPDALGYDDGKSDGYADLPGYGGGAPRLTVQHQLLRAHHQDVEDARQLAGSKLRVLDVFRSQSVLGLLDVSEASLAPGAPGSLPRFFHVNARLLNPQTPAQLEELGAMLSNSMFLTAGANHLHALLDHNPPGPLAEELVAAVHFYARLAKINQQRALALASAARGDANSAVLKAFATMRASPVSLDDPELNDLMLAHQAETAASFSRQQAHAMAAQTARRPVPQPNFQRFNNSNHTNHGNAQSQTARPPRNGGGGSTS